MLKGQEIDGWVQLTRDASIQARLSRDFEGRKPEAGAGGKVAWALIDGKEAVTVPFMSLISTQVSYATIVLSNRESILNCFLFFLNYSCSSQVVL